MHKSVLALALLVSAIAQAQTALQWQQGLNPLNTGWRTQTSDNPAWASPAFNDSGWQPAVLNEPLPSTPGKDEERWYRLRIDLPAEHPPLALLVDWSAGMYEVYVNGNLLPGAALLPTWRITSPKPRDFFIDASGPVTIALRTRIPATFRHYQAGRFLHVSLGTAAAVADAVRAEQSRRLDSALIGISIHLLLALAALPLVLLSRLQRDHREYFWVGLNFLFLACYYFGWLAHQGFGALSQFFFLGLPALYLAPVAQIEFTFSFAGRPVTRVWRAYQVLLLAAAPVLVPLLWWNHILSAAPYDAIEAALLLPASAILPVLLLAWYRRGNREAGWLILPSLLPLFSICVADLGIVGGALGSAPLAALMHPIPLGELSFFVFDPGDLVYLLAIAAVVFLRFNEVSRQQARSAAELEAAQRVQSLLLRSAHAEGTRFRIEAVYRPAAEVGGDFFHAAEIDGVTRIVVGDVSGKGLGAAMLVSALIGALDANRDTDPSALLKQLNEMLLLRQQGGFTTCLVLRVDLDGAVTLANAGHIPPYMDGREQSLDYGLPLGLVKDAFYNESTLVLRSGHQLTLVTDGVPEATDPTTGELFGFERTAAISTRSAEEIALAAQQFGQEDDITVLTLAFAPAEVLHA
jgi:hypothetical protein